MKQLIINQHNINEQGWLNVSYNKELNCDVGTIKDGLKVIVCETGEEISSVLIRYDEVEVIVNDGEHSYHLTELGLNSLIVRVQIRDL